MSKSDGKDILHTCDAAYLRFEISYLESEISNIWRMKNDDDYDSPVLNSLIFCDDHGDVYFSSCGLLSLLAGLGFPLAYWTYWWQNLRKVEHIPAVNILAEGILAEGILAGGILAGGM